MSTKRPWTAYGRYGSVGIELVISVLVGIYGGRWLDERFAGGHGWITILGLVVGVFAGFRQVFRAAKLMQREAERADRDEAEARATWGEKAKREADGGEKSVAPAQESSKTVGDDEPPRKD